MTSDDSASRPSSEARLIGGWIAVAAWLVFIGSTVVCRIVWGFRIAPAVPIVLLGLTRRRVAVWSGAVVMAWLTVYIVTAPKTSPAARDMPPTSGIQLAVSLIDIVLVAWVTDQAIIYQRSSRRREELLRIQNHELAARRLEAAQQSRYLAALLELSRSQATETDRSRMLEQVCQAARDLFRDLDPAVVVREQIGDVMQITCHAGFMQSAAMAAPIAMTDPAVVAALGAFEPDAVSDLAASSKTSPFAIPGLSTESGGPYVAMLSAPLRGRHQRAGLMQVYTRQRHDWTEPDKSLIKSLAAQAAVSLEMFELFEDVDQERRRLRAMFETVPFGIALVEPDGHTMNLNPAARRIFSTKPPDGTARIDLLAHTDGFTVFRNGVEQPIEEFSLRRAVRSGQVTAAEELQLRMRDGRRIELLVSAAPIRVAAGSIVGAVVAFADITPLKQLQEELEKRRAAAEEEAVRKGRFLAAASHDIRTPANAIGLLAELLQQTAATPENAKEVAEIARELQKSAAMLVSLAADVLDVTRLDTGKIDVVVMDFPLSGLIADACRQQKVVAEQKGLTLCCDNGDQNLLLRTDRVKLARVLGNLIANGIKFTDAGHVHVRGGVRCDGQIAIDVTDTGPGIAPEFQEKIFDEYFQLRRPSHERERTGGSGLGLAICRRLVASLGGQLAVVSEPGKGSTFSVILPASKRAPEAVVAAESGSDKPQRAAS